MPDLWETTTTEIPSDAVLLIPLGSTEQHGAHLPLTTDSEIASRFCEQAAQSLPYVYVSRPLPFGASGEHQEFAGTISLGTEVMYQVLLELGRSAALTFALTVFVNAHGGNAAAVKAAMARLSYEQHPVASWHPRMEGDMHAGDAETSMMLRIDASRVVSAQIAVGDMRRPSEIMPLIASSGMKAVSPNGVLGDPTTANRRRGESLLDSASADLVEFIRSRVVPGKV